MEEYSLGFHVSSTDLVHDIVAWHFSILLYQNVFCLSLGLEKGPVL